MITGELPDFTGETYAAIREQDFRFAYPAGIDDDVAGRWEARMVLVGQSKVEITERNPTAFTAPSHVDDLAPEREHVLEFPAGVRRKFLLEFRFEIEGPGLYP